MCILLLFVLILSKLDEDGDYILYAVYLFKHIIDEFKMEARQHKYIVRTYEKSSTMDPEKRKTLVNELQHRKEDLIRYCSVNYAEIFTAWVHLKCIRTFVEATLRFGVPAQFTAVLFEV